MNNYVFVDVWRLQFQNNIIGNHVKQDITEEREFVQLT
jgi:hypothetical protein